MKILCPICNPRVAPRLAIVERFDNGFWIVRYGPEVTEIELLRPWQFRFSVTNPPEPGRQVELRYESARGWGLSYAYPITEKSGTPSPTP